MKNLLNKFITATLIAVFTITYFPLANAKYFADEMQKGEGEVIVDVMDENGAPFSGTWLLHKGPTDRGIIVRNGNSGESFFVPSGNTYTLIVHRKTPNYKYFTIFSESTQGLEEGGTIEFIVQYYKTKAQQNEAQTLGSPVLNDTDKKNTDEEEVIAKAVIAPAPKTSSETYEKENVRKGLPMITINKMKFERRFDEKNNYTEKNTDKEIKIPVSEKETVTGTANTETAEAISAKTTETVLSKVAQLPQTGPSVLLLLISPVIAGLAAKKRK